MHTRHCCAHSVPRCAAYSTEGACTRAAMTSKPAAADALDFAAQEQSRHCSLQEGISRCSAVGAHAYALHIALAIYTARAALQSGDDTSRDLTYSHMLSSTPLHSSFCT